MTVGPVAGPHDPITTWSACPEHSTADGLITGDPVFLAVVPEPAALSLLGIGTIGLVVRRLRKRVRIREPSSARTPDFVGIGFALGARRED